MTFDFNQIELAVTHIPRGGNNIEDVLILLSTKLNSILKPSSYNKSTILYRSK